MQGGASGGDGTLSFLSLGLALIHEEDHCVFQMLDAGLAGAIKSLGFDPTKYGLKSVEGDSMLIGASLQAGCPGAK